MREIDELAERLRHEDHERLSRFSLGSSDPIRKLREVEAILLRARGGAAGSGAISGDARDRLEAAVRSFQREPSEIEFRTFRQACSFLASPLRNDHYVLLADPDRMEMLVSTVAAYVHDPRRARRLYDVLRRTYFGVDRQAEWFKTPPARAGNEMLRQLLASLLPAMLEREPVPDWLQALADYPDVLSTTPGKLFVDGWLSGAPRAFEDATRRLQLNTNSWLASETLRAAIKAAIGMTDAAFREYLSLPLSAAKDERFRSMRDEILADLLTRYSQMSAPAVHTELRDALIAAWKNPWLERNASAWGRVPPLARKMVSGWLKLELIQQFFEVLSEDGKQETRRFEFWRKYHERMDDVYFALGADAYKSKSPDMMKLKHALEGRLLELKATDKTVNAFIMCMDSVVFVEFSKTGNAAYSYPREDMPDLDLEVPILIADLKCKIRGKQMTHHSKSGKSWEDRFSMRLSPRQRGSAIRPAGQLSLAETAQISIFAAQESIRMVDLRKKGGNLWLYVNDTDPAIARQLKDWGFRYRAGRGWWWAQ